MRLIITAHISQVFSLFRVLFSDFTCIIHTSISVPIAEWVMTISHIPILQMRKSMPVETQVMKVKMELAGCNIIVEVNTYDVGEYLSWMC